MWEAQDLSCPGVTPPFVNNCTLRSGARSLMQAIESVRSGGKLVGVSWFGAPLELDVDLLRERSLPIPVSGHQHAGPPGTHGPARGLGARAAETDDHPRLARPRSRPSGLRDHREQGKISGDQPRAGDPMPLDGSNAPYRDEIQSLRDLSPHQWKSGIAAWLGWLFDGLDMHLYVLVAAPFVAELIGVTDTRNESVGWYSSWIQAAFLVGWAIGGGFFGRIGDRIGRSRALCLTILTYALFTGLAFFAQTWWQLLIVRFLAALGIGGEWAVGASLLSETWPRRWRPWIAAVLQSGVNIGVLLASCATFLLAGRGPRVVFLVGVLPALLVLWIRRAVPETEEWHSAKQRGEGRLARHRRPVPRRGPPHGRPDHPGLLRQPDGALGFHVLVPATLAELAGRDQPVPCPEE